MTTNHTPGPWVTTPEPNGLEWGVDAGPWGICICADDPGNGTAEANARLIAAAPELLSALVQLLEDETWVAKVNARSVIAKATGA